MEQFINKSDVVAFIYPAYLSFKALKARDTREIVPWLMYWIVLAFFSAFETVADIFVFWLPFYNEVKMLFVLWLILPQTKGHIIIYRHFIHPVLLKHEQAIDTAMVDAHVRARGVSSELGKKGLGLLEHYAKSGTVRLNNIMLIQQQQQQQQQEPSSSSSVKVGEEPVKVEEVEEEEKKEETKLKVRKESMSKYHTIHATTKTTTRRKREDLMQKMMNEMTDGDYL